jgi:aromatic-L-amino-acid/L-tryptophan decarboxylase
LKFYPTGKGHGCHQKAIELMGIGSENLRSVKHDRSLRMNPSALNDAIREDRQNGDLPIAVVASAGTVNTGAIDPLDEIADVCEHQKLWLHVDGARTTPASTGT